MLLCSIDVACSGLSMSLNICLAQMSSLLCVPLHAKITSELFLASIGVKEGCHGNLSTFEIVLRSSRSVIDSYNCSRSCLHRKLYVIVMELNTGRPTVVVVYVLHLQIGCV